MVVKEATRSASDRTIINDSRSVALVKSTNNDNSKPSCWSPVL